MLGRLLRYARRHRRRFGLAALFSILNKVFDLAPPLLIGLAVDIVVEKEQSVLGDLGIRDPMTQIWVLAAMTVLIWMLESRESASLRWITSRTSTGAPLG